METITKYNNRKLYSKKANRYVSLGYVKDLIKTGQKFQVTKYNTKEDVTRKTIQECLHKLDLDTATMIELIRSR